ncbi:MAG TPA: BON domain-containing protein [bacterium]|nr:BON domain-containing protein [bacterium]
MANPFVSDPKDVELEATISRSIRGMAEHLHVSVRGGHVTVSGTADDYETKRDIMSAVKEVPGVHEVTNNIRVARVAE